MNLRPRYSLLAFLLFTALVAGGVKLWRGPHHVVDRSNPQMEDKYTYYRDWDGTKIVDGVRVRRYLSQDNAITDMHQSKFSCLAYNYYRQGEKLEIERILYVGPIQQAPGSVPAVLAALRAAPDSPLTEAERVKLEQAIQQEEDSLIVNGQQQFDVL